MYRPKNCKNCGNMQTGGIRPRQQDYPDYESWQVAMEGWMNLNAPAQILPKTQSMNLLEMMNQQVNESTIDRPAPDMQIPTPQLNPMQDAIAKGVIDAPRGWDGTAQQYYDHVNTPVEKKKDKIQELQRLGIGLQGARTGLSWLAGAVERNRQNQFDMTQQTALGQMNPIQVDDFQPNPYNLYMMKGGKLKKVIQDYNNWSNNAQFDFGSGDNDKGMMQKGGRTPIVTNNPNDPRLRAYNDSLNLYKAYQMQDKLMGDNNIVNNFSKANMIPASDWTPQKREEGIFEGQDFKNEKEQFADGYNGLWARKEDKKLLDYYKTLGFTSKNIMYHSSPDLVHPKIRAIGSYFDGTAQSPIYKKPVQPVVYQELQEPKFSRPSAIPREQADLSTGQMNPNISSPNMQRAEWDMSKPSSWSITSPTGLYNEQETLNFPDEATWRAAMGNYKNISSQQMDGKGTATGDKKMKKGGYEIDRMLVVRKLLPELLNLGRLGTRKYRGNGMKKGGLTPNKAREILHDGTAHGNPLTDKQRRFFGAKSKGHTNYRGK